RLQRPGDTLRVRAEASLGGERVCLRMRRGEGEEAQVHGDGVRAQGTVFREEPGDLERDDLEEVRGGGVRNKTEGRYDEPRLLPERPKHLQGDRALPPPDWFEVFGLAHVRLRGRGRGRALQDNSRPPQLGVSSRASRADE